MQTTTMGTETKAKVVNTILIEALSVAEIKVTFSGDWDGRLIKGAIRSIERQYKHRKYDALRGLIKVKHAEEAKKRLEKKRSLTDALNEGASNE